MSKSNSSQWANDSFFNKENIDSKVLEKNAQEKLNTFSEDVTDMVWGSRNHHDFAGWADDNILLDRINRTTLKTSRSPQAYSWRQQFR